MSAAGRGYGAPPHPPVQHPTYVSADEWDPLCFAAATLLQMRDLRNRVAHDPRVSVSPEQAAHYARQAFGFMGTLAAPAEERHEA